MPVNIPKPEARRPIVFEDLTQHDLFRDWIRAITDEVNKRSLLFGTCSPDGVVEALEGGEYKAESGEASNIKYIKLTNDVCCDNELG